MPEILPVQAQPPPDDTVRTVGFSIMFVPTAVKERMPYALRPNAQVLLFRIRGRTENNEFIPTSEILTLHLSPEESEQFVQNNANALRNIRNSLESFAFSTGAIQNSVVPE